MKSVLKFFVALFLFCFAASLSAQSFYDFKVKSIDGKDFDFAALKGKKVMLVNVASKCGHTKQYAQLEAVYKKYKGKNFVIIAFPANNFGEQEPGTNEEIAQFCSRTYGVTFPMMAKISVKGADIAPVYKWLTQKKLNGAADSQVKWNFQKYLVNADGTLFKELPAETQPDAKEIISWIES